LILGASIKLKDQFSSTFSSLAKKTNSAEAKLKLLGRAVFKPTIRIKDEATKTIGSIKSSLTSLQGLAVITLGALGVGKLGEATFGQAMDFEAQMVSMEHWLKGNKALAKEAVSWLDAFAAATPFEMGDLFPAMSRGIGVSNGDLKLAERLVTLSADMAALTPGKTVGDAMEALADAQMGEFERLKEFNMKMTKDEMDKLGGFTKFLAKAETTFGGGAEKLSKTARGRISTFTDTIKTLFRSTGTGMLEAISPRLEKISKWFDDNKETVQRWKDNLVKWGKEGFEVVLKWGEKSFLKLESIFNDPEFQKLDFSGKLKYLFDTAMTEFQKWLDGGGQEKINAVSMKIIDVLSAALEASAPRIAQACTVVGGAIAEGIFTAAKNAIIEKQKNDPISFMPFVGPMKTNADFLGKSFNFRWPWKSNAAGVSYVPYDNYYTRLHRGERVLTAAENRAYPGSGRAPIIIEKLADRIDASNPADVDRLIDRLVARLISVEQNMPKATA
jgi:hypothetical protein